MLNVLGQFAVRINCPAEDLRLRTLMYLIEAGNMGTLELKFLPSTHPVSRYTAERFRHVLINRLGYMSYHQ